MKKIFSLLVAALTLTQCRNATPSMMFLEHVKNSIDDTDSSAFNKLIFKHPHNHDQDTGKEIKPTQFIEASKGVIDQEISIEEARPQVKKVLNLLFNSGYMNLRGTPKIDDRITITKELDPDTRELIIYTARSYIFMTTNSKTMIYVTIWTKTKHKRIRSQESLLFVDQEPSEEFLLGNVLYLKQ